jgi:hypothetical protein
MTASPTRIDLKYKLTLEGWKEEIGSENTGQEFVTPLGIRVLSLALEILRRRPSGPGPFGLIVQFRKHPSQQNKVGALVLVQELPAVLAMVSGVSESDLNDGCYTPPPSAPKLLTSAVYEEQDYDECARQILSLLSVVDQGTIFDARMAGDQAEWYFDIVFQLKSLDEEIPRDDAKEIKGRIVAHLTPVIPPKELSFRAQDETAPNVQGFLSRFWSPAEKSDNGTSSIGRHLEQCLAIPWDFPVWRRFSGANDRVAYAFSSKGAAETLRDIGVLWRKPSIRNIAVMGPSGSGKEVTTQLIHVGRARGKFVSISTGGSGWESLKTSLLGQGEPGGRVLFYGNIEESVEEVHGTLTGGTVMFDEIEKAGDDFRAGMLRVMEADEFRRPGNGELVRLAGGMRPLFSFVGGGGLNEEAYFEKVENDWKTVRDTIVEECKKKDNAHYGPVDFWYRFDDGILVRKSLPSDLNKEGLWPYVAVFLRLAWEEKRPQVGGLFAADRLLKENFTVIYKRMSEHWAESVEMIAGILEDKAKKDEKAGKGKANVGLRTIRTEARSFAQQAYEHFQKQGTFDSLKREYVG